MTSTTSPLSVAEAQHYLHLVQTLPAERHGPHRMFKNPAVDAAPLRPLAARLAASIERRDERTYVAPSAWHAAAWLLDVTALIGQGAAVDGDSGLRVPYDAKYGAPVFRGQRDPSQRLLPTLYRDDITAEDTIALQLLVGALKQLFAPLGDPVSASAQVHMAALQHHGMPTTLLDFTADPHVAVFFACRAQNGVRNLASSEPACVFGLPLSLFADLNGSIVFAPPWLKRLYAQRGVFLDWSPLDPDLDVREACFRVLFPPDPSFALSAARVDEGALLAGESWLTSAIAWARGAALGPLPLASPADALVASCGKPPFFLDGFKPGAHPDQLETFADLFDWLALRAHEGSLVHDLGTIEVMAKHNMALFRRVSRSMKFIADQVLTDPARRQQAIDVFPWFAAFTGISHFVDAVDQQQATRAAEQTAAANSRRRLRWVAVGAAIVAAALAAAVATGMIDAGTLTRLFATGMAR